MPTPQEQDLVNLYIQESRDQRISPTEVDVDSWVEAQLALEKYLDSQGVSSKHSLLVEDFELFRQTLQ